ncbi:hypothetical protein [Radiobacillus sp. PE A8.2]|uniref:hypothetical protein n=1 Tax=Radiobacillus sp. PE A8.2 TaxID=3380349 RepID=UPI00388FBD69
MNNGENAIVLPYYKGGCEWKTFNNQVLNFAYLLLDVNRYKKEELVSISNLMSSVFLLDQDTRDPDEIFIRLRDVVSALQKLTQEEVTLFTNWLKQVVVKRFSLEDQVELLNIMDNSEAREGIEMYSNLEENLKKLEERGEQRGKRIGEQRGERIGERRGERIGEQRGKELGSKNKAIEIAKLLLHKNMSIDEISEITGLDKVEIDAMKNH